MPGFPVHHQLRRVENRNRLIGDSSVIDLLIVLSSFKSSTISHNDKIIVLFGDVSGCFEATAGTLIPEAILSSRRTQKDLWKDTQVTCSKESLQF